MLNKRLKLYLADSKLDKQPRSLIEYQHKLNVLKTIIVTRCISRRLVYLIKYSNLHL